MIKEKFKLIAQRILPVTTRRRLDRATCWPPVGWVRFGNLRRLRPISTDWGSERGRPIDRYYIERFLANHSTDIRGHVLEIGTNKYTRALGAERVTKSDVLHVSEKKPDNRTIG